MLEKLKSTVFYSRLLTILIGVGVFGTVNLIAGFLVYSEALLPGPLIRSVVSGAIAGVFMFELYRTGRLG